MLRRRRRGYVFKPFAVVVARSCNEAPCARSGHRVTVSGSSLWLVGGYNPIPNRPEPVFRELWQYNLAKGRWCKLTATAPPLAASSAACSIGKHLLVFGGTGSPFGQRCSNHLHIYDTENPDSEFQPIEADGPAPLPQYGQAILYHWEHLYTVGGTDGMLYTMDIHRLNLRAYVWESVFTCTGNRVSEPDARYRHELAFDGEDIYVLAGGTADSAFDFENVPIFNLRTRTWSFRKSKSDKKNGYPQARKCHSAVQLDNEDNLFAFIMGGFDNNVMFSDLWRLEIPSLQWTLMTKSSFPYPLYFHSSAITAEGCMYTFGGIRNKPGNVITRSNKLYKLWLCIPKLSEMCWESLLFYFPNIVNVESSKLLMCGIPIRFIERLKD